MKKLFLLWLLVQGCLMAGAQGQTIFLFEEFTTGKIHFKNHSVTTSSLNYDAGNGRMLYMQNDEMMEVANAYMIDSISFGTRQFVLLDGRYAEKIQTQHGAVYVNWKLKDVNIGSKGAFGMPTQGKVETLNNYDFGLGSEDYTAYDKQKVNSTDMFRRKNANTYLIHINGELKEIKSLKQLIKYFPGKETEIQQYLSDSKTNLKETDKAIELLDYCLSLENN